MSRTKISSAIRPINDESRVRPSLNLTAFPNAVAALFWASTTQVNQTTRAWTVDFNFGISSQNAKTDRLCVRCVALVERHQTQAKLTACLRRRSQ